MFLNYYLVFFSFCHSLMLQPSYLTKNILAANKFIVPIVILSKNNFVFILPSPCFSFVIFFSRWGGEEGRRHHGRWRQAGWHRFSGLQGGWQHAAVRRHLRRQDQAERARRKGGAAASRAGGGWKGRWGAGDSNAPGDCYCRLADTTNVITDLIISGWLATRVETCPV